MATKSTAVATKAKANTNVVSIKDALKAQVAALAGRTAPASGNAIRITQDKYFVMPDGTRTQGPIELVVVDFVSKNIYYPEGFDAKNIVPPTCFAIGTDIRTMVPSVNSPVNQNAGRDCASCAMNQWESDPKGGRGKACKNSRALAVLPPDAAEDTPMWLLNVSPTATKNFDGFVSSVARVFEVPPVGVTVTVGFNINESYPSLTFSDPKVNEQLATHFARQPEATQMLAIEPDVSGWVAPTKSAKPKVVGRR